MGTLPSETLVRLTAPDAALDKDKVLRSSAARVDRDRQAPWEAEGDSSVVVAF